MKISQENAKMIVNEIRKLRKEIDDLENLMNILVIEWNDHDRHDVKVLNKLRGWLINLQADFKRASKGEEK